jgi:hypothetical protein
MTLMGFLDTINDFVLFAEMFMLYFPAASLNF